MTVLKRVSAVERLVNSPSGNPRWKVSFDDGTSARTSRDSQCAYSVGEGMVGQRVDITVDLKGEITHLVRLGVEDASTSNG